MEHIENESLLSLPVVATLTGLSANSILALSESGLFPSPVLFDGDEVWLSSEIADWLENSPHSPMSFAWWNAA
jgi:predicted DNA-binding transcriptional regulator AlpA